MTLILLFTLAQTQSSALVDSKLFTFDQQWQAIEASPRIRINTREGGNGTAVIVGIKDGIAYALTAAHVVRENMKFQADFFLRTSYPGGNHSVQGVSTIAKNPTADLALLQIPLPTDKPPPPVLKIIPPNQRPRAFPFPVLSIGCDEGGSARSQLNEIVARRFVLREQKTEAFFWESVSISVPGRSGGPLLNDKLQIIGICAANQYDRGYFAYSDEIHAWLKQLGYEWLWK